MTRKIKSIKIVDVMMNDLLFVDVNGKRKGVAVMITMEDGSVKYNSPITLKNEARARKECAKEEARLRKHFKVNS